MDRRRFLKLLGLSAPAIVAPTYFLAPKGGWHKASSGLYVVDKASWAWYNQLKLTQQVWVANILHGPIDACSLSRSYNRHSEPLNAEQLRKGVEILCRMYA